MGKVEEHFQRFSASPVYNTKAVVQRTGVPADTLRAWERRYGLPHPSRTEGRHRSYSDRDIALINWLREQTDVGLTISQAVALLESDTPINIPFDLHPASSLTLPELCQECNRALLDFDLPRADAVLTQALGMYPLERVCLDVLQQLMIDTGLAWQHGSASIAQEHAITAFIRGKLATFFNAALTNSKRGSIVLACAPGEYHDLGLLMVALFLSRRGWRVTYLGSDVPGNELRNVVQHLNPQLVGVSASLPATRAACLPVLQQLVERPPSGSSAPAIGYGGQAFLNPSSQSGLAGHYLGDDALQACSAIEALLSA